MSAGGLWPGWPPLDLPMVGCRTSINWPQELFGARFFKGRADGGPKDAAVSRAAWNFFLMSLLRHKRELYVHVPVWGRLTAGGFGGCVGCLGLGVSAGRCSRRLGAQASAGVSASLATMGASGLCVACVLAVKGEPASLQVLLVPEMAGLAAERRVLQQRRDSFTSTAGKGIDRCLQREATR